MRHRFGIFVSLVTSAVFLGVQSGCVVHSDTSEGPGSSKTEAKEAGVACYEVSFLFGPADIETDFNLSIYSGVAGNTFRNCMHGCTYRVGAYDRRTAIKFAFHYCAGHYSGNVRLDQRNFSNVSQFYEDNHDKFRFVDVSATTPNSESCDFFATTPQPNSENCGSSLP